MYDYQKLGTIINDFYAYKDSVENFLKSGDIFDPIAKQHYNMTKQQCLNSLLCIFSLTQEDTVNPCIRTIATELMQTLSSIKTPDDLSWTSLSSCSTLIQRIHNEMMCVLQTPQANTKNMYIQTFTTLTESFRNYIGMPMSYCSFTPAQLFLQSHRYTVMSLPHLHALIKEIDTILSVSLFADDGFKQSSYGRFPGFLAQLKNVVETVVNKKHIRTPVKRASSFVASKKKEHIVPVPSEPKSTKDPDLHNDDEITIPKKDYLHRLSDDWEHLLSYISLDEEITQDTYSDVFEEHKEHILSLKNIQEFKKFLNARVRIYKSYTTRNNTTYWMGSAMIFLQNMLKKDIHKKNISDNEHDEDNEENILPRYQQTIQKQKEERAVLLRKQTAYFPQIILLLQQFKQKCITEYFSFSPQKFRTTFVQQYDLFVTQPVIQFDPELFGLDESALSDYKHRKYELYKGIPSLISKGSDELIKRGIKQGFIFGEINDLIDQLQKIYDEHNT